MGTVIVHSNPHTGEYFLSTDHCQVIHAGDSYPDGFVSCTFTFPQQVAPRPGFEDGWLRTAEDVIKLYHGDGKEVPNPEVRYQPLKSIGEVGKCGKRGEIQ